MRIIETELQAMVEEMLSGHFGRQVRVAHFERRPFAYQTSSAIDMVDVRLDNGTKLELLLKNVGPSGMQGTAARAKPEFLHNPLREIAVYHQILAEDPCGTALCYGSAVDAEDDRYWLLLEHVDGRELYQVGEWPLWQSAAQWLARMHAYWSGRAEELQKRAPLLNQDAEFYRMWLTRAVAFQSRGPQPRPKFWQRLVDRYDGVIEALAALPKTLIHGEFYASNVLVNGSTGLYRESSGREGDRVRVCPVDWEMAAVGPALMDMASLTAGDWSDEERLAFLEAYRNGLGEHDSQRCSLADLKRELDFCRLHVAVQWLGWSSDWKPPVEHTHDWLAEAIDLTERLGL